MRFFQLNKLAKQAIVFGVAYLRRILHMIETIVPFDLIAQLLYPL